MVCLSRGIAVHCHHCGVYFEYKPSRNSCRDQCPMCGYCIDRRNVVTTVNVKQEICHHCNGRGKDIYQFDGDSVLWKDLEKHRESKRLNGGRVYLGAKSLISKLALGSHWPPKGLK